MIQQGSGPESAENACENPSGSTLQNPCLSVYGPGPEGWRCGSCANVSAVHVQTRMGQRTIYYCCLDGQAKRVTWPACERFIEAPLTHFTLMGR